MISYVFSKFGNKLNIDIFLAIFLKKMIWLKMATK
jgi:hypothetical protein